MSVKCGHCSTRENPVKHDTIAEVRACAQRPRTLGGLASGQQELRIQPPNTTTRPSGYGPEASISNPNAAITVGGHLHQGYFTVVFEDGERRTLRVRRQRKDSSFRPGDLLVAFLTGANNEGDYTKFASVEEKDGKAALIRPWKRFRDNERLIEALRIVAEDPQASAKAYSVESGNCAKCNLLLTVPQGPKSENLNPYRDAGYGPKCGEDIFG